VALSESLNRARQATITTFFDLIATPPYATLSAVASDRLIIGDMTAFQKLDEAKTRIVGRGSIEGFHGNYHNFIGGDGHMGNISVAAFDPVFWFHHAQIDRVWSLWQAFHPDLWFPKATQPNQKPENEKDLLPFYLERKGPGDGKFYTSDNTKSTEDLGYAYDDLVGWKKGNGTDALLKTLKAKYDWQRVKPDDPTVTDPKDPSVLPSYAKVHASYFFTGLSKPKTATRPVPQPPSMKLHIVQSLSVAPPAPVAMMSVSSHAPAASLAPAPVVTKINPVFDREWYVDSSVQRSAGHGPFTIYFFLALQGEVPSDADAASLARSPFLAGINHLFVASSDACDNCGDLEALGQISSDTTPITPLLLTYLELPEGNGLESLRPEHVKPLIVN
jgi:tyrosinase